jgi:AraC family transcriptional regulator
MLDPKIVTIEEKKLIGARVHCSLQNDKTGTLWQQFMPKRKQIKNRPNNDYISVQNFSGVLDLQSFSEETEFERWAAVEVLEVDEIPEGLEALAIQSGKYAVFVHHGLSSEFEKTKKFIFEMWLPNSGYQLDDRVHFEVMGAKYFGPSDANSEEEIWIPIK